MMCSAIEKQENVCALDSFRELTEEFEIICFWVAGG